MKYRPVVLTNISEEAVIFHRLGDRAVIPLGAKQSRGGFTEREVMENQGLKDLIDSGRIEVTVQEKPPESTQPVKPPKRKTGKKKTAKKTVKKKGNRRT